MNRSPWILFLCLASLLRSASAQAQSTTNPFWSHWSDGKAEIDGYDLIQPRYGQLRHGRAVLIYVTEPFLRSSLVKPNQYDPNDPDQFVALKLNLLRKFQTGIYDYSLMTSLFADPKASFRPVKLTFTAQEWCGHVFEELRFLDDSVHSKLFSYFEGETQENRLPAPPEAATEDELFIRLRQLDRSQLDLRAWAGPMLGGVTQSRLQHRPLDFFPGEILWQQEPVSLRVPAGQFQVHQATWKRQDGTSCNIQVEADYPHRIIAWACADGEEAKLSGSARIDYWRTQKEGDEQLLQQLGLRPLNFAP